MVPVYGSAPDRHEETIENGEVVRKMFWKIEGLLAEWDRVIAEELAKPKKKRKRRRRARGTDTREAWMCTKRRLRRAIQRNKRRRFDRKRRIADQRHRKQELEQMKRRDPWKYAALTSGAVYAVAARVGELFKALSL